MDDGNVRPSIRTARHPISEVVCRSIHDIHLASLPDDVMPNFGYKLERNYLQAVSKRAGAVVLAHVDERIVGFLSLRFDALNMVQFLSIPALFSFASASLAKPKIIARLVYQFLKVQPDPKGSAEIDYFAVDERLRGRGVGRALLAEAERLTLEHGLSKIFTKTNNETLRDHYVREKSANAVYQFSVLGDVYHGLAWDLEAR